MKILDIKHCKDDYVCMWNGIEDLYLANTLSNIPPKFFFSISSFGSFCYMKTPMAELKRMIALGDGRTRKMYEFLAPIVGFEYKFIENKTFENAVKKIKGEIDNGYPCVIGALDMFYLPHFEKIYHHEHIPFHYELVIGYDDNYIYFNDCGREETQKISYDELKLAFDCSYPGLSKPNTIITIRMNSHKDKYEITKEALKIRKEQFLNPPVSFIGYKGLEKFIKELPLLKKELSKEDYDKILFNMVQFMGTVPTIPNALKGIDEEDTMEFHGGFDKISVVLSTIGEEYHDSKMIEASKIFSSGGYEIVKIKDVIVNYLANKKDETDKLVSLFSSVLDCLKKGFETL